MDGLRKRNCSKNVFEVLRSYFSDRNMNISGRNFEIKKQATRGCPQGSVLGPACWNIMFDKLLKLLDNTIGDNYVAYADDLVVLISGNSRREIEIEGQNVVSLITQWCESAKLKISEKKTEAILLKSEEMRKIPIGRRGGSRPDRKRKNNKRITDLSNKPLNIKLGGQKIRFRDSVRYLGINLGRGLNVGNHCHYLGNKVESLFNKLRKLAKTQWGLRYRSLYTNNSECRFRMD